MKVKKDKGFERSMDVVVSKERIRKHRKKVRLDIPCLIKKKVDDLIYPNARHVKGRWLSFPSSRDFFLDSGVPPCSMTAFAHDGGSFGRCSPSLLLKLYRGSDGYLTKTDVMISMKLTTFLKGDIDLSIEEIEEIITHYEANSLPIRHAVYAFLTWEAGDKKILAEIVDAYKTLQKDIKEEEVL